ncbi:TetR/AcrR family transcriptional regulator [Nocardioides antri]|uniref:TetR/AcrR family transcriptional regulator n=2 Tax=Nocardioides antri TaxID=2607659 RepID=A0A5B1M9F6_9ACTN|nr:TetR/AcrR family transcriptional regulator [Nocardioides antri]
MTGPGPGYDGVEQTQQQLLLAAALEVADADGLSDLSLRQLADRLGTSHRMLIYHFGSKQGLLAAVVGEVERRQREVVAEYHRDADISPIDLARRLWKQVADPAMWPQERLFFELYAQALRQRDHTGDFLNQVLEPWFELLTEIHRASGQPLAAARTQARLGVAVVRGLLLDLLATGDRRAVDRAMALFLDWYGEHLERGR